MQESNQGANIWKTMIVNKLMYECGALVWYQHECGFIGDTKRFWKMAMGSRKGTE